MKRTLFLSTLLLCCAGTAAAATYDSLSTYVNDAANGVVYNGKGYFAVNSAGNTSVDITLSLSSLLSYVNSNDYKTGGYMLKWDTQYDYGLADNADMSLDTGSRTPYLSGYWSGAAWNASTNNISYDKLNSYADGDSLTLYITNSSTEGVTVTSAKDLDNDGVRDTLYTASGLKASGNTSTTGYWVNLNYVTSVTLNTSSTLDTSSYVPPVDYSEPFVSLRTDNTTVGRVTFLGDSITHGVNDASYRWQLFKTLTDNGIENEIVGPCEGYYSSPGHTEDAGNSYGGVEFANVHLAQASGRTHNIISGSTSYNHNGVSYSSGVNYGGNSTSSTAAAFDSNTWFCMMGTNDLLSDTPNSGPSTDQYATQMQKVFGGSVTYSGDKYQWSADTNWGTMGKIVSDVCKSGDTFYLLSITPWGNHSNHNRDMDHYAGAEFNRNMELWADAYSQATGHKVVYVDVTRGMVDLTSDKRFMGYDGFFNSSSDRLHPNDQGSLIMAGNLAQAMGIGGRTAGLVRMGADAWDAVSDITVASGSTAQIFAEGEFSALGGYTVDLSASFGDGETGGWLSADQALSITLGDGTNSGTLNLSEGYISWGNEVLFCADTSELTENIRIAWHEGSTEDNVLKGYYVWLGDMLIGQGLDATTGASLNGITLSATGANGSITTLSWIDAAYAPTTTGMVSAEHAFLLPQTQLPSMPSNGHNNTATTSGVSYAGLTATTCAGDQLVKNAPTEDSSFVVSSSANWFGMVGTNAGKPTGAVNLQITGNVTNTVFGAMNGAAASTLVLDVESGATIGGGSYNGKTAAIAGSYGGGSVESFNVYINGATVNGDIVGGSINGTGTVNEANIVINSGTVNANVIGGAKIAGAGVGSASIRVNGGKIIGNIVAGGEAGSVDSAEVLITGGVIGGSITKGTATTCSVTVVGNKACIGGNIEADSVTLRQVEASGYSDGFDRYSGTITAKSLVLDDVQVNLAAKLVGTSDVEITGGSHVGLVMGDAVELETLTLGSGTVLSAWKSIENTASLTDLETTLTVTDVMTVGAGAGLNANLVFTADSTLSMMGALAMGSTVALSSDMTLKFSEEMYSTLNAGKALTLFTGVDTLSLDGKTILAGADVNVTGLFQGLDLESEYILGWSNSGEVYLTNMSVPEPTTATLTLMALAALASRRRRSLKK